VFEHSIHTPETSTGEDSEAVTRSAGTFIDRGAGNCWSGRNLGTRGKGKKDQKGERFSHQ
jgi:hypothetical protein